MTNNTRMRASLALIAAIAIAACGSSVAITPAPTQAPAAPAVGSAAASATLSIANFAFDPASIKVKVGTKVTWTNNDGAPHTVTAADGAFHSGRLSPAATFDFTFKTVGTFTYHCAIHSSMTGTVTVSS